MIVLIEIILVKNAGSAGSSLAFAAAMVKPAQQSETSFSSPNQSTGAPQVSVNSSKTSSENRTYTLTSVGTPEFHLHSSEICPSLLMYLSIESSTACEVLSLMLQAFASCGGN